MVRMAPAPLIHGAAMVATLACLFAGDTAVILPKFDPHAVWEAVQRHQVNVLSVIGDAMARPLMEALAAGDYDTSSLVSLNSTAALFSPAGQGRRARGRCPTCSSARRSARPRPASPASRSSARTTSSRGGPTVTAGPGRHRDRRGGRRVRPRADRQAGPRRARPARLLQRPGQDRRDVHRGERQALRGARRLGPGRGRRRDHPARPGQHLREHRRREGLPGRGRGRAEVSSRRVRLAGHRRARRPPRPAGGRAGPAAPRRRRRPGARSQAHVHGQLAGYKVPRTVWFVDSIGRTVSGKADYRWARQYVAEHPPATPAQAGEGPSAP